MSLAPQVSPSPEIQPALDENRPQFGPNLAADPTFSEKVMGQIFRLHGYPQILQQQQKHRIWSRIDDAYRVKGSANDLDIAAVDPIRINTDPANKGRGGLTDQNDGYSSRVYPATLHKQIVTKTDLHMSIAWDDGLPVRADKDPSEYEHPLYNPVTQSIEAKNMLLRKCAEETGLKKEDRKGRGSLAKYGHAWASIDFQYELQDEPQHFLIPPDPQLQQQMLMELSQRFQSFPVSAQNGIATWMQRTVKKMQTTYTILRVDDVFIDQTMPADMEKQICPMVRSRVNRSELFGNEYDPDKNPFGYVNTQQALDEQNQRWSFDFTDSNFQRELRKKNLSTTGIIPAQNAIKEKWVAYPLLGIQQTTDAWGKPMLELDDGNGVTCPQCKGSGRVMVQHPAPDPTVELDATGQPTLVQQPAPQAESHQCLQCQGRMKVFVQPERYVVEMYGNMASGGKSATCLRIQAIPTPKKKVPILFTATFTEDMAGAIPMCKAEASLKAVDQEATALNFWNDCKNGSINPPWLVPEGSPYKNKDLNRANQNIEYDGNPGQYVPMRQQLDFSANILPFLQNCQNDTRQIMGANDTLLGEIQSGRRSASEIQNAYDASKTPIVIEVDQYNEDMLGGWAQFHLDNIEAFADRAWIQAVTGRATFGKVKLFSAVAAEFMKRQAMIGNLQYIVQMVAPIPGANIGPVFGAMCKLMKLPINPDEVIPDGGVKKARQDGMQLVTKILGQGQLTPPAPSDPHPIYIEIFEQALQDPYWQQQTPETLPLLQQRLQMQMQIQLQQQQMQLMAQQRQIQASLPPPKPGQGGNGNQPQMPNTPPATAGGQNQQTMGGMQS